jgi:predicted acylesterase/phospholipase RssA
MTTALVLSGGGAKGSFEVGALVFLYGRNVRPDIICGCSVGAINGVKLAEGEDGASQGLKSLLRIWLELRRNEDMFLCDDWVQQSNEIIRDAICQPGGGVGGFDTSALREGDYSAWGDLAFLPKAVEDGMVALAGAAVANEVQRNLQLLSGAKSIYNLTPIEAKMRGDPAKGIAPAVNVNLVSTWAGADRKLRLAAVSLEAGALRYVTETGAILERDNYTPLMIPTQLSPACAPIKAALDELIDERRSEQADLQDAVGSSMKAAIVSRIKRLNTQIAQRTAELNQCKRQNPAPRRPAKVDLVTGVLASASIPALFRAVSMEGETYVDGGVREVLPLQAALDLGADTIYAISASRPDVVAGGSFKNAHMFEILGRAMVDVAINEVARDDQHPIHYSGARIVNIQPSFDVHEMTVIEPGLIRVAIGYGFMCASDVIDGETLEEKQRQNWVDDDTPAGAQLFANDDQWTWVTVDPRPVSGTRAHKSAAKAGMHQHFFTNAAPMQVGQDDVLFAHVFLDSQDPPAQVMLQWNDGSWEHRAYWGQSRLPWGVEDTPSRRYMGELPLSGRWVRLDVPAYLLGLGGTNVHGMAFTLYNGSATWDVAGRRTGFASRARSFSNRITRLRQQVRQEEMAQFAAPTPELLQSIQGKKREIRSLVRDRMLLGVELPAAIEKSWMNWEWFAPANLPAQPWPDPKPPSGVPAVCQPIATEIAELEGEKADWQEQLQEASSSGKAAIVAQIKRINTQITQRKTALATCIAQNPPPPPPLDPIRHGLLLRGSGPEIYVLYGGSKLWIRSMPAFNGMGYTAADVLTVPDGVLAKLPQDRPADGTLLATKGDPKVFVMLDGQRRWVTGPAVLDRDAPVWDSSWPHIRYIPSDTLAAIPAGPDVT